MATLKHATEPLDRQAKADWHGAQADHIEALLTLPLSDEKRQQLQADLLQHRTTEHHLRTWVPGPSAGRMKSFVGTDMYAYNG